MLLGFIECIPERIVVFSNVIGHERGIYERSSARRSATHGHEEYCSDPRASHITQTLTT